jgi:hypothetical protein
VRKEAKFTVIHTNKQRSKQTSRSQRDKHRNNEAGLPEVMFIVAFFFYERLDFINFIQLFFTAKGRSKKGKGSGKERNKEEERKKQTSLTFLMNFFFFSISLFTSDFFFSYRSMKGRACKTKH